MDYVIGVDIGTQSTKALLCDGGGRIIAQRSSSYQPDTPQPLWAEQWPQVWVDAVFKCIAGCVGKAVAEVPGTVLAATRAGIDVACGRGVLRILRLQLAGRKPLPAQEFIRGQRLSGARFAAA